MSRRLCVTLLGLALISSAVPVIAAQGASAEPNRLVTGKVIYVERMPDQLDQWIIEDLRAWGKYQIASNEQGVDLVLRAVKPVPKTTPITIGPEPHRPHRQQATPPVLSLSVFDWVSGTKLWEADVVNSGPKKNEKEIAGPETVVYAKHMTPDQIATRSVDLLRKYVEGLEQGAKR